MSDFLHSAAMGNHCMPFNSGMIISLGKNTFPIRRLSLSQFACSEISLINVPKSMLVSTLILYRMVVVRASTTFMR